MSENNRAGIAIAQIPVINLKSYIDGDHAAKSTVAKQVRQACQETGFFYLQNHGIPETLITQAFAQSKQFFNLSLGIKKQLAWSDDINYRSKTGYIGLGQEALNVDQPTDFKEGLDMSKKWLEAWNWSGLPASFHETMIEFYSACNEVSDLVLRVFALALDLPESFFVDRHTNQEHELLLLHYPPVAGTPHLGRLRAGEHTDYGTVTFVFQDDTGGLEILSKQGKWLPVSPIAGAIVVNTADLLQRWTNHIFTSSRHRVVAPSKEAEQKHRYSIAFFCNPNSDLEISCLDTCQDLDRPPIYPPVMAGAYIEGLLRATIQPNLG